MSYSYDNNQLLDLTQFNVDLLETDMKLFESIIEIDFFETSKFLNEAEDADQVSGEMKKSLISKIKDFIVKIWTALKQAINKFFDAFAIKITYLIKKDQAAFVEKVTKNIEGADISGFKLSNVTLPKFNPDSTSGFISKITGNRWHFISNFENVIKQNRNNIDGAVKKMIEDKKTIEEEQDCFITKDWDGSDWKNIIKFVSFDLIDQQNKAVKEITDNIDKNAKLVVDFIENKNNSLDLSEKEFNQIKNANNAITKFIIEDTKQLANIIKKSYATARSAILKLNRYCSKAKHESVYMFDESFSLELDYIEECSDMYVYDALSY